MAEKSDAWIRRSGATARARTLRQNETDAEYKLWYELRNRQLNGYKFTRQVPLGPFVADFVCREQKLIVELDGSQHAESKTDEKRTAWLNDQGYSVLRFWNDAVFKERQSVLDTILAVLERHVLGQRDNMQFYPSISGMKNEGDE